MRILKILRTVVASAMVAAVGASAPVQAQHAVVLFALDDSKTVNVADRNAICLPSLDKVVAGLNVGDTLMIYAVDDKKMSEKLPVYEGTFEARSSNRLHAKVGKDTMARNVRAAVETLQGRRAMQSRYGDGFMFAAGYLASKPADVKRLYICGDGVEEGPALDLSKGVPKDAMARFARAGLVPSDGLSGVEVNWIGLGTGKNEALHYQQIRQFWADQYFKTVRAKAVTLQRLGL